MKHLSLCFQKMMILRYLTIFSLNILSWSSLGYLVKVELEYSKQSIIILLLILFLSISLGPYSYSLAKLILLIHTSIGKNYSNFYAHISMCKSAPMKNVLNLQKPTYLYIRKILKMYTWPIWISILNKKNKKDKKDKNNLCINHRKSFSLPKTIF